MPAFPATYDTYEIEVFAMRYEEQIFLPVGKSVDLCNLKIPRTATTRLGKCVNR